MVCQFTRKLINGLEIDSVTGPAVNVATIDVISEDEAPRETRVDMEFRSARAEPSVRRRQVTSRTLEEADGEIVFKLG